MVRHCAGRGGAYAGPTPFTPGNQMLERKFKKVEPDSPVRCEGRYRAGQCPYEQIPGSKYCRMHGGWSADNIKAKAETRLYRLTKWKNRVNEIADDEKVKGLREEIGILRVVLEETINMCSDTTTLLIYSAKIADLVTRIEKIVSSCHRLEASTSMLLDKTAALHLASVIVEIISRFVTDENAVESISNEIISAILNQKTEIKEKK